MKKMMTAALGLSLLSGAAVFAAQNTSTTSTDTGSMHDTMKSKKKMKHHKKGTAGDTMSSTASTSTTK